MWAVLHRSDAIPGSVGAIENTEVIMSKFLLATALLTVLSAPALAAHPKAQPELNTRHVLLHARAPSVFGNAAAPV